MSADNCIAICKFRQGWKVAHCQAIENLFYWRRRGVWMVKELNLNVLYRYFKNSKLYKTREQAYKVAEKMLNKIGFVEYGIIEIKR